MAVPNPTPTKALKNRATQVYDQQSRTAREHQLILDNLPLVRHVVNKISANLPEKIEVEDLVSAGTVGLVRAAKAYDSTRDTEFSTYAYIRIRGAVLDELRSRSFVPTGVYGRIRQIQDTYQQMTHSNGVSPDDEQLARRCGISTRELYQVMTQARSQQFLSIHGLSDEAAPLDSLGVFDEGPGPDGRAEKEELRRRLADALMELPKKDRIVVVLYYERDLTMKEIAEVLDITESRVSQLHAAALFKLATKLKG